MVASPVATNGSRGPTFPVDPMKAVLGTAAPRTKGGRSRSSGTATARLAFVGDGHCAPAVVVRSRRHEDVPGTRSDLPSGVNARSAIVDTELVVLGDTAGLASSSCSSHALEAVLYVFDVLSIDGTETITFAYEERRQFVTGLVEPGANWLVPAIGSATVPRCWRRRPRRVWRG